MNGSTVDDKGFPLRMKIEGERRLDQRAKKFKLGWNRFEGVVLVPEES